MTKLEKAAKHRSWVLVNTFLTLTMLGFILVLSGDIKTLMFTISAPFSMAFTGTYLVDHLLSYFECVTRVKDSQSDDI